MGSKDDRSAVGLSSLDDNTSVRRPRKVCAAPQLVHDAVPNALNQLHWAHTIPISCFSPLYNLWAALLLTF
jgi:hypothetical protein